MSPRAPAKAAANRLPERSPNKQPEPCRYREAGSDCRLCNHEACGWCPECYPEVPEW